MDHTLVETIKNIKLVRFVRSRLTYVWCKSWYWFKIKVLGYKLVFRPPENIKSQMEELNKKSSF